MMKKITLTVLLCAVGMTAMAKPAYRGPIVRTAEDGTEKIVYLHGNEDFHYMTDENGQWLDEMTLKPMSTEAKVARLDAGIERAARKPQRTEGVGDKPNIAPRGLVVLVNFQDVTFTTPTDTIDAMLNSENFTRNYSYYDSYYRRTRQIQSQGSVKKYFEDQSYGEYSPVFDVVGPVTVSENMKYYGENDYQGNDKHPELMIKEACELADSEFGVDFTQYDNDDDGLVDFVYVIYAGYGEADGGNKNTVWPHQWNLWDYGRLSYYVDGKKLNRYACGNELSFSSKQYDGIGTICHEFSHVLGLPDLYITTEGASHHTLCDWDIMDYGPYNNDGNTPPCYSAYERFYMGWLTPRVLDTTPQWVRLTPINVNKGDAILMCKEDDHNLVGWNPSPKQFYLLEARTQDGWDEYLPGEGMLITKINYSYSKWSNNTVNNTASAMGVDMIEAQTNTRNYGVASDAYPAGKEYWTGLADHEVTDIAQETDGTIVFSLNGGTDDSQDIEDIKGQESVSGWKKVVRNGQMYILRDGKTYNMLGSIVE